MSGTVPPPAARPLERAARVLRPVCPGCGRCGRGDRAPAPQRAPLRAGVPRCGGGGRVSPGGVPSTIVRGVWGQAPSLSRLPAHWAGCWGPLPTCCGRGCVGVGAQRRPRGLHALWGLHAAGLVGGRPRGGWLATVVRGTWCQALSLPRPPVLWSGQPGFRVPCVPGAVVAGVGTQHRPHSVWGQALSLSRLPAHWAGCWGPPPTCCGCGCVGVGAQHCPLGLHALWGLRAAGVAGGRPRGGWPATAVRSAWCQALSLPRPPVLWSGQPGFRDPCVPGAVDAGVGTQHQPRSVRPCGPALLAVGVAEGRPRWGCLPPL